MGDFINNFFDPLTGYTGLPRIDSSTNITTPPIANDMAVLTNLMGYTLVGQTLSGSTGVRVTACGTFNANLNVKTVNLLFGATTVATFSGAFNGGAWRVTATILRVADNSQVSNAIFIAGTTPAIGVTAAAPTEDTYLNVLIQTQGQGTLTGDVTQTFLSVENI